MENNIEDFMQESVGYSKIEAQAIDEYISNIYSRKVPEPVAPTRNDLSFWKISGIEAVLFTLASIGVIGFSSIRTGGFFFIIEQLILKEFNMTSFITDTFAFASMVFSLMAFELYVAADGFAKGKDNKGIKRSTIGVWASIIVIVLAGMFTGMGLVDSLSETVRAYFYVSVALITAVAGGVVAFFSGENVGFTFSKVERSREELKTNHQLKYQKWRESAVKAYLSSHYNIHKTGAGISGQVINVQSDSGSEQDVPKKRSKMEMAYDFIEQQYKKNGKIPTAREVEKGSGVSVGTAFSAVSKFTADNKVAKPVSDEKEKPQEKIQNVIAPKEKSVVTVAIDNFIAEHNRFPEVEEITSRTREKNPVVIAEMIRYAVENKNSLFEKGLLTQDQINQAVEQYSVN